jgi:hypothetical protein
MTVVLNVAEILSLLGLSLISSTFIHGKSFRQFAKKVFLGLWIFDTQLI